MTIARNAAFPFSLPLADGATAYTHGLTKRELFAAMAMQGMCSTDWSAGRLYDFNTMANDAVGAADALLKELAK